MKERELKLKDEGGDDLCLFTDTDGKIHLQVLNSRAKGCVFTLSDYSAQLIGEFLLKL